MKCSASLTPSCSSPLCSQGLQDNSFLHIDMLIITGILFAAWVLQKQFHTGKCLEWGDTGSMYLLFIKDLREPHDWTHFKAGQHTKHNLSPSPAETQLSVIVSHLLPLPFPHARDIKEAWPLYFLKMELRYH